MENCAAQDALVPFSDEDWFDPLEEAVRFQVRGFIEAMVEQELQGALGGRGRYERKEQAKGYRNGYFSASLSDSTSRWTPCPPVVSRQNTDLGLTLAVSAVSRIVPV